MKIKKKFPVKKSVKKTTHINTLSPIEGRESNKKTISVSIIGHNEEKHLRQLLPTLTWAKEVIYVDCESSDDSVKIARKYHCRIYQKPNNPNLNINKQFGISQAKGDWILYLDPDERLTETGIEELLSMTQGQHDYHAFRINRKNFVLGRVLRYGDIYPDTQLRFFKNGFAKFPQKHIHEFLQVKGKMGKLKSDMIHYSYYEVRQMLVKFNRDTSFEGNHMFTKGVRPSWSNAFLYIILKPIHLFILKYFFKRAFLDGYPGLIFAFMSALHFPIRYFKMWELTHNLTKPK